MSGERDLAAEFEAAYGTTRPAESAGHVGSDRSIAGAASRPARAAAIRLRRRVVFTTAVALVVPGLACSAGPASDDSASRTTASSSPGPPTAADGAETSGATRDAPTEWVAVYRTEPYPEAERTRFIDDAGRYICECVVSCFPGLPTELDVDRNTYFLGLVAPTAEDLESAQGRIAGEATFVGELPSLCRD